jgi:predicted alpha/beta hydrolase
MGERGSVKLAGEEIAVTRFPARGEAIATVLVPTAMGVRQDFYAPFAEYLAEAGLHVTTFDWRGMGWSRPARLRGYRVRITDWAREDLDAMLHEARAPAPHLPLLYVGHSLGGQLLGIVPGNAMVRAMLTVNAGNGWYRFNQATPWRTRFFWFAAVPLLTPLFGYFPGKRLRMVGDLPSGVAWQWRRWCTSPHYMVDDAGRPLRAGFERVRVPVRSYSFTDDDLISQEAVLALHGCYTHAQLEHRHLAPGDLALERIGHFGFFTRAGRDRLWEEARGWLLERAQS